VYREALTARHYARRTIGTYERWLWRYLRFHRLRHPRGMGGPEINSFLSQQTVWHFFANPLLERSSDIPANKELLGHSDVKTTMVYEHALNRRLTNVTSPGDLL